MRGSCGLLLTNSSDEEVSSYFENYRVKDYARAGAVATTTISFDEGPLPNVAFSLEPHLRKLGLPVVLKNSVVHLFKDYTVCSEGEQLTPEQAKILKIFDVKMSEFRVSLVCKWNSKSGFEELEGAAEHLASVGSSGVSIEEGFVDDEEEDAIDED